MKLTSYLLKDIPPRFRGKYRIVRKPTFIDLLTLRHDFEREERNMLILRHPYLTSEQSYGHMKDIRNTNLRALWASQKNEKFSKHITLADRLNHLTVTEGWD